MQQFQTSVDLRCLGLDKMLEMAQGPHYCVDKEHLMLVVAVILLGVLRWQKNMVYLVAQRLLRKSRKSLRVHVK